MWNNYPVHEMQTLKRIPYIDEALKEVKNDRNEKKKNFKDGINEIQRERKWEEVFKEGY